MIDLKVKVRAKDVQMMVRCPIPTYLIGIDEPATQADILSIHGPLTRSISSMPSAYPLDCKNLKTLWDEERAYWRGLGPAAETKNSAFRF